MYIYYLSKPKPTLLCFVGTVAVVSLMTGSIVSQLKAKPGTVTLDVNVNSTDNYTTASSTVYDISSLDADKIALAASVCFLVGVIQVNRI